MKNKKLFAILTLVCFMMTLMPVAAFAAIIPSEVDVEKVINNDGTATVTITGDDRLVGKYAAIADVATDSAVEIVGGTFMMRTAYLTLNVPAASVSEDLAVVVADAPADITGELEGEAIFTEEEVEESANNAADYVRQNTTPISYDTSIFVATDGSDSYDANDYNSPVSYTVKFRDDANTHLNLTEQGSITIWAEEVGKPGITTSALDVVAVNNPASATVSASLFANQNHISIANAFAYDNVAYGAEIELVFKRAGEYKVFATATKNVDTGAIVKNPSTTVAGVIKLVEVGDVITVDAAGLTIPQQHYTADATVTGAATVVDNGELHEGVNTPLAKISTVKANNINDISVKVEFDNQGQDLTGKTVAISTNSANLNVSKASATTNALGAISFSLSAAREGQYKVYLSVDGCTWVMDVVCGNTDAAYIEVSEAPKALVPLYGVVNTTTPTDGDLNVQVFITDINGNAVIDGAGVENALANTNGKYVSFVTKPADSKLASKQLKLVQYKDGNYVLSCPTLDAEGAYEVKIVLDNGNYVTVPFTVKEFQTPVRLILAYPQNTIELGGELAIGKLAYMDANGVMKATTTPELAATGHAISSFDQYDAGYLFGRGGRGVVTVKSDEKYVGSTITVTAVDDRYDLVATTTLTVADEAAGLAFSTETAEVNVNNKITVNVVDAKGNKVALGANTIATQANISYVVLDKPADAKVSVYTADDSKLMVQGQFVMALTSNKVGNVKVQAVVKLTTVNDNGVGTTTGDVNQVKYYTGVQEFAVGTGETGKSVVMSIGSNELIVGSKVEKMDAKPMIQNNRTYVPFRALAEAFGATVAYDQATSSVTAELNGVKVVMTVGSPVYTVNGVEKTADVAPFVSDSRTFVPVRFAAEAFGIKVVPTYNEDGSVADVLFNM